jgi:predicted RNA-binding protein with PIN domain
MAYLIDGHNLIPKIAGFSLEEMDDEQRLIALLQTFSRQQRKRVEVFFDQAPPGMAGTRRYGVVTAHFVRQGLTADEAIIRRLKSLGNDASNWTVVSSDHHVQSAARAHKARVVSSETFARQLLSSKRLTQQNEKETTLSPEEVDYWLRLFGDESLESGENS